MHSSSNVERKPRKRSPVRRIVIAVVLAAVFAEPVVMYVSLQHERAQRMEAASSDYGDAGR
jgi:hypothetical protein